MTNKSNVYSIADEHQRQEEAIYDQASLWIAKIDRELTEAEQREFSEWLAADPQHVSVFSTMASLWDNMDALNLLADLFPTQKPHAHRAAKQSQKRPPQRLGYLATAASALLLMVVGWFGQNQLDWLSPNETVLTYQTEVGESSTIVLEDNSKVSLNTDSVLNVTFTDSYRLLELKKGELYIDVAHDVNRPLNVVVNDKVFQALGTAFNVQVDKGEVELIVTDGKVAVVDISDNNKKAQTLSTFNVQDTAVEKGQKVSLSQTQPRPKVEILGQVDIKKDLSWRTGNLIFKGETLEQAMGEVSRYTKVKFKFAERSLKDIKIAGRFKTGDVDGLVQVLNNNFNIEATRINHQLVLLRKKSYPRVSTN